MTRLGGWIKATIDVPGARSLFLPLNSTKPDRLTDLLFYVALALGPALALWDLHRSWNPNGEYAYGWAVPILALLLFKLRWDGRPAPSDSLDTRFWAVLLASAMIPSRWLLEAAPERSICAWGGTLAAVGVSLCLIGLAGGYSWVAWFAFPLGFVLTAVPWPHMMEFLVTQSLVHRTVGVTVEILTLIGVPSMVGGNLIHIDNGVLDIDEACSGIRSLQAMVMLSLFFGEWFRLKLHRRLGLLLLGVGLTLLANIFRAVILAFIGFNYGMKELDAWHDPAGFAVLALTVTGTFVAAMFLQDRKNSEAPSLGALSGASTVGKAVISAAFTGSVIGLLLGGGIAVEGWYRFRHEKWEGWIWTIQWLEQKRDFHFVDIPVRTMNILRCDASRAAKWTESDGSLWTLYSLQWNPGNPSAEVAKVHRPDICLKAEGAILEKDLGLQWVQSDGINIPFHCYQFRLNEAPMIVYFCSSEEGGNCPSPKWNPCFEGEEMVQRAWEGRRSMGLQSLELAVQIGAAPSLQRMAIASRLAGLIQCRPGARAMFADSDKEQQK